VWPVIIRLIGGRLNNWKKLVIFSAGTLIFFSAALNFYTEKSNINRAYLGTDTRIYQPLMGSFISLVIFYLE
jgi:peptidoglycan/LPS O-acetylase OafA/YrhL